MSADDHLGWQYATGDMRPRDMAVTASIPFDASDFDALKAHVREHGFQSPASIDYRESSKPGYGQNYIRQGHHRRRIAQQLDMPTMPANVRYREGAPSPDLINPRQITREQYEDNMRLPGWTERR